MYEVAMVISAPLLFDGLVNYRHKFPLAKPAGSIESTIKLLIGFHEDPVFQKAELKASFELHGREVPPDPLEDKLSASLEVTNKVNKQPPNKTKKNSYES